MPAPPVESADRPPEDFAMRHDLLRALSIIGALSCGVAAADAQQQPPPAPRDVFVNGALAVPGAPTESDTVPAKFSAKNAADDELITVAYTFKTLTADQRRAIYPAL